MSMAGHPQFLLWRAEPHPDNIGGARVDRFDHGLVFGRACCSEGWGMGADDLGGRELPFEIRFEALNGPGHRPIKKVPIAGSLGMIEQCQHQVWSADTVSEREAALP